MSFLKSKKKDISEENYSEEDVYYMSKHTKDQENDDECDTFEGTS